MEVLVIQVPSRNIVVEHRDVPLSEAAHARQVQRGLYVVERGERFAIPADSINDRSTFEHRKLWAVLPDGSVGRPGVVLKPRGTKLHGKALAFLRDHVDQRIPYWYYLATLGHDLHVSTWADLYAKHWHGGWANPFEPDRLEQPLDADFATLFATHFVAHDCRLPQCPASLGMSADALLSQLRGLRGFTENLGLLSSGKVTTAFVSEEIDELVSTTGTEYADFDFHEVGTSSTAEANSQTALVATSGIARATGTPTDADPIYRNVGTITADATETWQEHGIFNNSTGAAMMDRSLTGGQSVASPDQVQYTYELTKNAEA